MENYLLAVCENRIQTWLVYEKCETKCRHLLLRIRTSWRVGRRQWTIVILAGLYFREQNKEKKRESKLSDKHNTLGATKQTIGHRTRLVAGANSANRGFHWELRERLNAIPAWKSYNCQTWLGKRLSALDYRSRSTSDYTGEICSGWRYLFTG